ncbi:MAG: hypothetical protein ACSLFB_09660 [Acidimicrobiales bacterium]
MVCLLAWIGTSVAGQFDQVGDQAKEGADEIRGWARDHEAISVCDRRRWVELT